MKFDVRLSPHMRRALEVLQDGSWHQMEDVVTEMAKVIPPGRAMRHAEDRRKASGMNPQKPAERRVPRSTEFLVQVGARHIAKDGLKHSKRLEFKDDHNGRWVRIKPDS